VIKKIDHLGIAVNDLDDALRMYKRAYNLEPIKIETLKDKKVRIAFIPLGEVLIELLEPTESGKGRIGIFLKENGEGFHHIALRVEDIETATDRLKKLKIPIDKAPRAGAHESKIVFIDPKFTLNVLTELVEREGEVIGNDL